MLVSHAYSHFNAIHVENFVVGEEKPTAYLREFNVLTF